MASPFSHAALAMCVWRVGWVWRTLPQRDRVAYGQFVAVHPQEVEDRAELSVASYS